MKKERKREKAQKGGSREREGDIKPLSSSEKREKGGREKKRKH